MTPSPFRPFLCPRCGAPHFGSEFPAGIDGPQVLICHGRNYDGCGWRGSWEEVAAGIEERKGNDGAESDGE